ncbi:cytochrome P450 4A10 [Saccharata proteae CBS 121410]|uniref:Cytochrome P450 4A10 n=1 Tax=Saccharata proteae CBS 121410 TaxID=1314787 RepID=A0A9P4I0B8_9PEZI|nr:cytochrome P450 4A10 [Saccharata proteae CBS 121410]
MALAALLDSASPLHSPWALPIAILAALLALSTYRLYLHPLAHIPGPILARLTSLYLYHHAYHGTEATTIDALHRLHGPIVRIAPNEVSISDGAALAPIYSEKGGFLKAPCYRNFDIEGHQSIFSAVDPKQRGPRAKAVMGMFATRRIREEGGEGVIRGCAGRMVERMERERGRAGRTDVLDLARCLALDAVSGYLFGRGYGGIDEGMKSEGMRKHAQLSASQFVNTFVAVGRFFYLPNWVFLVLEDLAMRFNVEKGEVEDSMNAVSKFVDGVVQQAIDEDQGEETYQGRMLKAGISKSETMAQCMDLMFAGTDSTGMNLATACRHLSMKPEIYNRLREEVLASPDADPQTLPYLTCVIKETLRISMANPTRLPRVVPPSGWTFASTYFPPGTVVGMQPHTLHFKPEVFPSPFDFIPERWEDPIPEMTRDHIPFGLGSRQCIARNLATAELFWTVREIAIRGVLEGAKPPDEVRILEWFNSKVVGEKIELTW